MNDPYYIESLWGIRQPVSAATHLAWCVVSVFIAALLVRLCGHDRVKRASVGCYGIAMVALYGISGVFHVIPADRPALVDALRRLDFSATHVLIAATYTPVFAVLLTGRLRVVMLAVEWSLALLGIACKWLVPVSSFELIVALFFAQGLAGFVAGQALYRAVGVRGLTYVLAGVAIYVAAGVCDALLWPVPLPGYIGSHEVVHVLVIAGTVTHVLFMMRFVIPYQRTGAYSLESVREGATVNSPG